MEPRPPPASSYRALFAIPGVRSLAVTMQLARLGGAMWNLTLILFVLQQFRSPVLAGLTTFVAWVPGLLVSPLGGALIDRFGRVRLIAFDMGVAVLTVLAILALSGPGRLTPSGLLLLVGISSITGTLSRTGTRSLIPMVVPRSLWERGNALDATTSNVALIAGPALAGMLFASVGGLGTMVVLGGIWLAAGLLVISVRDAAVPAEGGRGSVLLEALEGLRYTVRNPVLRGLAVIMPLTNAGDGIFQLALPVLFRSSPYGGSAVVGALWSVFGMAAVVGALLGGRMATQGRERRIILVTLLLGATGYYVVAAAPLAGLALLLAALGLSLTGVVVGLHDIAMFSFRQRAIDPAWLSRAMSISMSVNALGFPLGTALAGPVVHLSLTAAMLLGASLVLLAALLSPLLLPGPAVPHSSAQPSQ
ncbi:MAG: MFS transporter [Candidatus Dormibacteraeota bacterium]|nr:MFS transporter [Candidatus Dormibacteraeota bacterium]MDQ6900385.1 MFS transporter [Candidatus Dormibacteraeota bacterium]